MYFSYLLTGHLPLLLRQLYDEDLSTDMEVGIIIDEYYKYYLKILCERMYVECVQNVQYTESQQPRFLHKNLPDNSIMIVN
jgi:hypothetical protein